MGIEMLAGLQKRVTKLVFEKVLYSELELSFVKIGQVYVYLHDLKAEYKTRGAQQKSPV